MLRLPSGDTTAAPSVGIIKRRKGFSLDFIIARSFRIVCHACEKVPPSLGAVVIVLAAGAPKAAEPSATGAAATIRPGASACKCELLSFLGSM